MKAIAGSEQIVWQSNEDKVVSCLGGTKCYLMHGIYHCLI